MQSIVHKARLKHELIFRRKSMSLLLSILSQFNSNYLFFATPLQKIVIGNNWITQEFRSHDWTTKKDSTTRKGGAVHCCHDSHNQSVFGIVSGLSLRETRLPWMNTGVCHSPGTPGNGEGNQRDWFNIRARLERKKKSCYPPRDLFFQDKMRRLID